MGFTDTKTKATPTQTLSALNESESILRAIEGECKSKLLKRLQDSDAYDPDPDATHVPDLKYYKDFIEGMQDQLNTYILTTVMQRDTVSELTADRDGWKEKAIKLQSKKK